MKYEVGDLVRCWHLERRRVIFSVGIIIKVEDGYVKVCTQDTGKVLDVKHRSIYLIKKKKNFEILNK